MIKTKTIDIKVQYLYDKISCSVNIFDNYNFREYFVSAVVEYDGIVNKSRNQTNY